MKRNLVITAVVAVALAGGVLAYAMMADDGDGGSMASMGAMDGAGADGPTIPPVKGYLDGRDIRFIHTEASDPNVAEMLTKMMGSPVITVPALAQAPDSALAPVYVFTNGVKGEGPFGFQPDVFTSPPGTEGYRPLRAVHLVSWKDEQRARVIKSLSELQQAEAAGAITIERPGAVVNMPMVSWPGGGR